MKGQMAIDVILAVLAMLTMLGVYTAFIDRGSVEVRRGLQYVICDLAGTKFARVESLLRLSGMGNKPGMEQSLQLTFTKAKNGNIAPITIKAKYNDTNVEVNIMFTRTTIVCNGRAVPKWQ